MDNKVALITGGCSKIGFHITKFLHSQNFNVCVHFCSSDNAALELVSSLNLLRSDSAMSQKLNFQVASTTEIQELVDQVYLKWQNLNLIVHNASIFTPTNVLESSENFESNFESHMKVNVSVPAVLTQCAVKYLKLSSCSCVINICDIHGVRPLSGFLSYSVSKAALISLTQSLAKELAPIGIRVNGVSPGAIFPASDGLEDNSEATSKNLVNSFGDVECMLNAISFLINSNFVYGQIINVDGGRTINQ